MEYIKKKNKQKKKQNRSTSPIKKNKNFVDYSLLFTKLILKFTILNTDDFDIAANGFSHLISFLIGDYPSTALPLLLTC